MFVFGYDGAVMCVLERFVWSVFRLFYLCIDRVRSRDIEFNAYYSFANASDCNVNHQTLCL